MHNAIKEFREEHKLCLSQFSVLTGVKAAVIAKLEDLEEGASLNPEEFEAMNKIVHFMVEATKASTDAESYEDDDEDDGYEEDMDFLKSAHKEATGRPLPEGFPIAIPIDPEGFKEQMGKQKQLIVESLLRLQQQELIIKKVNRGWVIFHPRVQGFPDIKTEVANHYSREMVAIAPDDVLQAVYKWMSGSSVPKICEEFGKLSDG